MYSCEDPLRPLSKKEKEKRRPITNWIGDIKLQWSVTCY